MFKILFVIVCVGISVGVIFGGLDAHVCVFASCPQVLTQLDIFGHNNIFFISQLVWASQVIACKFNLCMIEGLWDLFSSFIRGKIMLLIFFPESDSLALAHSL